MSKMANTLHNGRTSPEEWEQISLGDIADIGTGNPAPQGEQFFKDGIYPFVRVQDMGRLGENKHIINTADRINQNAIGKMQLFPKGTVLFTKSGASSLLNQRGILKSDMYVVSHIATAIPFNGVLSEYLYYRLKIIDFNSIAHATTLPSIPLSKVYGIQISLASSEEQKQIVNIIEEIFSDLDSAVENLKKTQEQLKTYRQAVLKYSFEGKWKKIPMQSISEAFGGCAFKSANFKESGIYQVIRIGNVRPGTMRLNISPVFLDVVEQKIIDKYLLKPGDVVISLTGTRKKRDYGYTTIVKEENLLLNQRLARLRFDEKCLPKFFLYYSWTQLFKDSFFASETGNVGQGNVGMKAIQSTEMPLPSIQEQRKIIQSIESRFSVCDKIEDSIGENLQKAEALRQSILKQAFDGKLTKQWRNDHKNLISNENSAEALLERIKAEKEALKTEPKGRKKHD
ncbi:MAG: restriction endonuclease subunit S [Candidatus Omnitrophica bacterium]|nr:restriction endonuclease subunit S [Candidatus Omnitrophota bacterium]